MNSNTEGMYKSTRMWRKCYSTLLTLMATVNRRNTGELQCTGTRCYRNLQRLCQTFRRWYENIRVWCRTIIESMTYSLYIICNYNDI